MFRRIEAPAGRLSAREETAMTDHGARALEYRARAHAERTAGDASDLAEVRAKHERAAQVWADLADAEDLRQVEREARRAAILARGLDVG
jgi:hypothetical protein